MSGKKSKDGKKAKKSIIKRLFKICLVLVLIACVLGLCVVGGIAFDVMNDQETLNILTSTNLSMSSTVYYTDNGNEKVFDKIYTNENREWVDIEDVSPYMKQAFISIEDERFEKHHGVDIKRTAGAVFYWIKGFFTGQKSYGGSTITQQLVKNITNQKDRSPIRKITEMIRAMYLETKYTKNQIIEMYMNTIYLANNCYGVQAAANLYFDKDVKDLTLAQCASIAGITQLPGRFDPFVNPDKNKEKQEIVLGKMYELGKITQDEYDAAMAEKLDFKVENKTNQQGKIQSYYVDQIINETINDLIEKKGYTESFAKQLVFYGGLKIYACVDPTVQKNMETVFYNTSNFPKVSGSDSPQSAMVVLDPSNGQVKGMIGGLGQKTANRGLNRATQMLRQPGSSIKPIGVYAPAIENKTVTPNTIIIDEPVTFGKWSPKNSYSGFKGNITVSKAVEISANIPAVKVLQSSGIEYSYNFLTNKLGITSLVSNDKNLSSLALGGLTYGVSPLEMAAAYATFANGGLYYEPIIYTKIKDFNGNVLLENKSQPKVAMSEKTALLVSNMLYNVVNGANGTGKSARLSNMPTYGKTGTTDDDKDRWFVGYTPYYVGAVWYGFDKPKSIKSVGVSYNPSSKAFNLVMEKIHSGLQYKKLDTLDGYVERAICPDSGLLASHYCWLAYPEGGIYNDMFKESNVPTKYCNVHTEKNTQEPKDLSNDSIEAEGETDITVPDVTPGPDIVLPADDDNKTATPTPSGVIQIPDNTGSATSAPVHTATPVPVQTPKPTVEVIVLE